MKEKERQENVKTFRKSFYGAFLVLIIFYFHHVLGLYVQERSRMLHRTFKRNIINWSAFKKNKSFKACCM